MRDDFPAAAEARAATDKSIEDKTNTSLAKVLADIRRACEQGQSSITVYQEDGVVIPHLRAKGYECECKLDRDRDVRSRNYWDVTW